MTEAERSNLAPDQVKIKEEYGGGYPAHVEGLHHLHCLVRFNIPDRLCYIDKWIESAAQVPGLELRLLPEARAGAVLE